jgi:hypothetical protein
LWISRVPPPRLGTQAPSMRKGLGMKQKLRAGLVWDDVGAREIDENSVDRDEAAIQ